MLINVDKLPLVYNGSACDTVGSQLLSVDTMSARASPAASEGIPCAMTQTAPHRLGTPVGSPIPQRITRAEYAQTALRHSLLIEQMTFEAWLLLVNMRPTTRLEVIGRRMALEEFAEYAAASRGRHIERFVRHPETPAGALRSPRERLRLLPTADVNGED